MLDLTTEECIIVYLGVKRPHEHGPHLHGAIADGDVGVVEVVDGLHVLDPPRKLPTHHSLWDDLRSWAEQKSLVGGEAFQGVLRVGPATPVLHIQEGERLLHLGVVHVSVEEVPGGPAVLQPSGINGGFCEGHHLNQLPVSLEVHLEREIREETAINSFSRAEIQPTFTPHH